MVVNDILGVPHFTVYEPLLDPDGRRDRDTVRWDAECRPSGGAEQDHLANASLAALVVVVLVGVATWLMLRLTFAPAAGAAARGAWSSATVELDVAGAVRHGAPITRRDGPSGGNVARQGKAGTGGGEAGRCRPPLRRRAGRGDGSGHPGFRHLGVGRAGRTGGVGRERCAHRPARWRIPPSRPPATWPPRHRTPMVVAQAAHGGLCRWTFDRQRW